jgi:p-hydroxybenzoate 3-monooxygenase
MAAYGTQVGIVGGGPAGLLLSQLLARRGIDSWVLERRSRAHVEGRVRAGVLEQATVETLCNAGVGERLLREGIIHHGIELRFDGRARRIDFERLVPGRNITVYGQREVVRDLIAARLAAPAGHEAILFEVSDVRLAGLEAEQPVLHFSRAGEPYRLDCEWVVGCDGFHGIARDWMPKDRITTYERTYPFAWLGVLAQVAPSSQELIYALHEKGFALHSMRSSELSRFYLQVPPDESLRSYSDDRIWEELAARLETIPGWTLARGPILEKTLAPMRSFVVEPMRAGRLFLAGDAAHIVPATGAKGLNLAVADVLLLSEALGQWYADRDSAALEAYSQTCLRRVWKVQHFSHSMTRMLHRFPSDDAFARRLQLAQLDYVTSSPAASTSLAENYVGLGPC